MTSNLFFYVFQWYEQEYKPIEELTSHARRTGARCTRSTSTSTQKSIEKEEKQSILKAKRKIKENTCDYFKRHFYNSILKSLIFKLNCFLKSTS